MAAAALPIMAATGVYSAVNANRNQKSANRMQSGVAKNQNELFKQSTPYYGAILQYLAQNAGLNVPGGMATPANISGAGAGPNGSAGSLTPNSPVAHTPPLPGGSGALPDSFLGIFGQNDQDRLAYGQAEDQINQQSRQSEQQLRYRLGRRGAGEATISSAIAQNQGDANQQLAAFRRQIALAARAEQERRVAQLLGSLNPGLGAGAAASSAFGGQAALAGNQANAAGAGLGSFLSNWMLAEAMKRQGAGAYGASAIAPGEADPFQEYLRQMRGDPRIA